MESGFSKILEAAHIMREFSAPWHVAGGWAIDLFLGQITREHGDIEIGIYRCDQAALWPLLPGWKFEKAIDTPEGGEWVAWERGEELNLPVHQIKVTRGGEGLVEFEFFLNEREGSLWKSRRHAGLMVSADEAALDSFLGIPIVSPEIQLLFKAKHTRAKDIADFEKTLPRLNQSQIDWLFGALSQYHPDHPWLASVL